MILFRWADNQLADLQEEEHLLRLRVLQALAWLKEQYECQGWRYFAKPEDVADLVLNSFLFVEVQDSLVAFSIDTPWFLTEKVVTEHFIAGPADLTEVAAALAAVGKIAGAVRVEVGTRAAARGKHLALARKYQQLGFAVSTLELTREILP